MSLTGLVLIGVGLIEIVILITLLNLQTDINILIEENRDKNKDKKEWYNGFG